MRAVLCLFFMLHMSLPEERCFTLNAVRLKGSKYAGLVEVCHFYLWRSVCGDNWTNTSAGVVCRQLNYTDPEHQDHIACGYSCFGRSNFSSFPVKIYCGAHYFDLSACNVTEFTSSQCLANAGLFCDVAPTSPNQTVSKPDHSTDPESTVSCLDNSLNCASECRTLIGTLSIVIAAFILILILVLVGWMCSCYKWATKSRRFVVHLNDNEVTNPTYDAEVKLTIESVRANKNGQDKANLKSTSTSNINSKSSVEGVFYDSIKPIPQASLNKSECGNGKEGFYFSVNRVNDKALSYEVPQTKSKIL